MIENVPELLAGLETVASLLENVNLPGLVAIVLCIPAITALAMFGMDYVRQRNAREQYAARRAEEAEAEEVRRQEAKADRELIRELMENQQKQADALMEKYREQFAAVIEQHRAETMAILRDLGEKHSQVSQYYKDNVEVVKTTQNMAGDQCNIILNNTRAMEALYNAVKANFHCPVVREAATGHK